MLAYTQVSDDFFVSESNECILFSASPGPSKVCFRLAAANAAPAHAAVTYEMNTSSLLSR